MLKLRQTQLLTLSIYRREGGGGGTDIKKAYDLLDKVYS